MEYCDFCHSGFSVMTFSLESEYYGRIIKVCRNCLKDKAEKGFIKIDLSRLTETARSYELLCDTACKNVKIGKDETCSFFLYPYLTSYELYEREEPDPGFEAWSREVYRYWVLFLSTVKKLENNEKKQSS